MAKVLMIIAFNGYRDEEYHQPKEILEQAGHQVTTASTQLGTAKGKISAITNVDITLDKANVNDYDAIAFIGGPGSYDYFTNKTALKIAQDTVKAGKILGGICAAAAILAHAGVLKDVKATSFPGVADILRQKGAKYSPSGFEVDGKIITADGPNNAMNFGNGLVKALS